MNSSTPLTIPQIASKLTKAQREAISSKDAVALPSMGPFGHDSYILGFAHGRSAKAIHARGLATLPFAPQILTPLGLELRQYLLNQDTAP